MQVLLLISFARLCWLSLADGSYGAVILDNYTVGATLSTSIEAKDSATGNCLIRYGTSTVTANSSVFLKDQATVKRDDASVSTSNLNLLRCNDAN